MSAYNLLVTVVIFVGVLIWLRAMDYIAHRGLISSRNSRKLIHIFTGPLFVLCWLLYDSSPGARYLAAVIPAIITLQFALIGLGIIKDEASVKAMSRSGERSELLKGPVYYGIVFVVITTLYWMETPVGVVALMLMCGGDGIADIVGRRFGHNPIPWNRKKTLEGSLAVLLGGWLMSIAVLAVMVAAGAFPAPFSAYLWPVFLLAVAAALVESLPFSDIDNVTVPLATILLGRLLLP